MTDATVRDWSTAWLVWLVLLLGGVFLFPNIWIDRTILVLFFVMEMWAAYVRKRGGDTLSEFMQFILAYGKGRSRWYQGWRLLVVGLLALIAWQSAYVSAYGYDGAYSRPILGAIVGLTVFGWNFGHWLNNPKHG